MRCAGCFPPISDSGDGIRSGEGVGGRDADYERQGCLQGVPRRDVFRCRLFAGANFKPSASTAHLREEAVSFGPSLPSIPEERVMRRTPLLAALLCAGLPLAAGAMTADELIAKNVDARGGASALA